MPSIYRHLLLRGRRNDLAHLWYSVGADAEKECFYVGVVDTCASMYDGVRNE